MKHYSLNIGTLISLTAVSSMGYYLLLHDNFLHTSITAIINYSQSMSLKPHLIVLGLLPIYIATVIFGTAILGAHVGSALQQFVNRQNDEKLKTSA